MNGHPAAIDVLKEGLKEFTHHIPPEALYHFYGSRALRALQSGLLSLTPPKRFNDPFEMWAGWDASDLTPARVLHSLTAPRGMFLQTIRDQKPDALEHPEAYLKSLQNAVAEHPDWAAEHLRSTVNSIYTTLSEDIGVFCLSAFSDAQLTGPTGIRHWAMYGQEHAGFCIAYDGRHSFFRNIAESKWMFPVEYRHKRLIVPLEYFNEWDGAKLWRTVREWSAMKSAEAWGHECEWRIIFPIGGSIAGPWHVRETDDKGHDREYLRVWRDSDTPEAKSCGAQAIRKVILGVRATEELKQEIRQILSAAHFSHVELWESKLSRSDFALDLVRLS